MFEELAAQTYRAMGFPVEVKESDKSDKAIITYPGWGAGFFVVDIDAHYGGLESFAKLKKKIYFPKTVTARTPRGGLHLYYRYPDMLKIPFSVDTNAGLDILSEDSRVHMPPTISKISDNNYMWIHCPQSTEMAYPSPELLTFIKSKKS